MVKTEPLDGSKLKSKVPGIGTVTVVLLAGLKVDQILLAVLRLAPHAPVQDAHDGDGPVEGGDGRAQRDVVVGLDELDEAFICRVERNSQSVIGNETAIVAQPNENANRRERNPSRKSGQSRNATFNWNHFKGHQQLFVSQHTFCADPAAFPFWQLLGPPSCRIPAASARRRAAGTASLRRPTFFNSGAR